MYCARYTDVMTRVYSWSHPAPCTYSLQVLLFGVHSHRQWRSASGQGKANTDPCLYTFCQINSRSFCIPLRPLYCKKTETLPRQHCHDPYVTTFATALIAFVEVAKLPQHCYPLCCLFRIIHLQLSPLQRKTTLSTVLRHMSAENWSGSPLPIWGHSVNCPR